MVTHLGKMRAIWAICKQSGQKCTSFGERKFNHWIEQGSEAGGSIQVWTAGQPRPLPRLLQLMLHWSWIHPVQGLFLIVSNICCPFCARLFFSLRLLMTQISSAILCRCQDSWIHQHCKESSMLAIGFFAKLLIMPHLWFPLMWYSSAQVEWF